MTTSPPRFQIWHPSRGISFSPGASRAVPSVYGLRGLSQSAPVLADRGQHARSPGEHVSVEQDSDKHGEHIATSKDDVSFAGATVSYPELPTVSDRLQDDKSEDDSSVKSAEELKAGNQKKVSDDPPYPALDYQMSEDLFRDAKKALPGTPQSYWAYSLYRGTGNDGQAQKPKVHYCQSKHTTERVCRQYFMNEPVIGFDLEWVADSPRSAGARRNVSLIQIASPSRIALFHVALFSKNDDFVAPSFRKIMEDPEITKVGVWIKGDATRLKTHLGIESQGLMELSHLYRLVTFSRTGEFGSINKRLIPLATQVEQYLHLPMFKGQDVRSSDWTRPLRMDQVIYSASDAYAGVQLYATLEHHRQQLDPCPPRPHHAELNLPIRLAHGLDLETDTEDELTEAALGEAAEDGPGDRSILSPAARKRQLKAHLKSIRDSINNVAKTLAHAAKSLDSEPPPPKDARVQSAEDWAAAFQTENQPEDLAARRAAGYATAYELRAYRLWHANGDMTPADVARLLRTPPLKTGTVANYIWGAVKKERLPVERGRYEREVVSLLPERTKSFARRV